MSTSDPLYNIFIDHLHNIADESENEIELIQKIVTEFLESAIKSSWIPFAAFQEVVEDLHFEVLEMYRKKTYGSISLEDYRLRNLETKKGPQEL